MFEKRGFKLPFLLTLILMAVPLIVGLYIRLDDISVWNKHKEFYYCNNRPLFTSYDAFYYARWGKEFAEGKYKSGDRDSLRCVPDICKYPNPVPLLSVLGGGIAKIRNNYIENVSLWLIPILSVLCVIPIFLYFYRIDLPLTGYLSSLVTVTSFIYFIRTTIARFDTDALNLFFPFAIALTLSLGFSAFSRKKAYLWLIVSGILAQFYWWWYSHPGLILTMIITYIIASFLFYRNLGTKEIFQRIFLLFLASNPVVIFSGIFNLISLIKVYLINYFHKEVDAFPNVFLSISEAKHYDLSAIARITVGNFWVFLLAVLGLLLLVLARIREIFLLLPILGIGILAMSGGNRFSMYLAPFLGAGLGYYLDLIVSRIKKYNWRKTAISAIALATIFLVLYFNNRSLIYVAHPLITPSIEKDFIQLSKLTPENAWIWTWWDYGTAIQYLANRAVFHDGQSQTTPKTYFVALSYSIDDYVAARNIILGVSSIGAKGIKKLLKSGKSAEQIKNEIVKGKFIGDIKKPIFWVFSGDEIGKFPWINYFGTWNFFANEGKKSGFIVLNNCRIIDPVTLNCGRKLINLNTGKIVIVDKKNPTTIDIRSVIIRRKDKILKKYFSHKSIWNLELIETKDNNSFFVFLVDNQALNSMFNKLYLLREYDKNYFNLIFDDFPSLVVYRVNYSSFAIRKNKYP